VKASTAEAASATTTEAERTMGPIGSSARSAARERIRAMRHRKVR